MGLDVFFREDIRQGIKAGIVLTVQTAKQCGYNQEFLTGALALAQHQALNYGISWPGLVASAQDSLGGYDQLLDQASKGMLTNG